MAEYPSIVWFRKDLRINDNAALSKAIESGSPLVCVYILESASDEWALGAASRWWLHYALKDLSRNLKKLGLDLVVRAGEPKVELPRLIDETKATAMYWNRRYDPVGISCDSNLKAMLESRGAHVSTFNSALLNEPFSIKNKAGKPFRVFTPFWRHCLSRDVQAPIETRIDKAIAYKPKLLSVHEAKWKLLPDEGWDSGIRDHWNPTEKAASELLNQFTERSIAEYDYSRNIPSKRGTSSLSPYLAFGQIGPRQIWNVVQSSKTAHSEDAQRYLAEIGWREFAYHLLYHFPHTTEQPLREDFNAFPWKQDTTSFTAWTKGRTGYPMVDAGMRELWSTGWMHNRVRMIVASFLVKHLLLPWQDGSRWFWDTLVDADLASNTLGWQWTAGCGADASPYFRIFNPITQGEKFDSDATYIKKWVPELSKLPVKFIHRPWDCPIEIQKNYEFRYGEDYPEQIISHFPARERALEAYRRLKGGG